jgi:hypothetical protein
MLPYGAYQQHRIRQPMHDGQTLFCSNHCNATELHLLSFRASQSQQITTVLAPPQRAYPVLQNLTKPSRFRNHVTQVTGTHAYTSSEHMLRRKTPNGTLAAGYDGAPVQWSIQPPALKHIVLPVSCASSTKSLGVKMGSVEAQQHMRSPHDVNWSYLLPIETMHSTSRPVNQGVRDWTRWPPLVNGPKTIFDRTPIQEAPIQHPYDNNAMQIPTVLQPPYQSCSGATASNDDGFYGPYWPDGRFVPYRPAAVRHVNNGLSQYGVSIQKFPSTANQSFGTGQHDDIEIDGAPFTHSRQPITQGELTGQHQRFAIGKSVCFEPLHAPLPDARDGLYSGEHRIMYNPPFPLVGRHQNAQFKEKALTWAHSVYIDLLSYLQHTKRGAQNSRRLHVLGRSYSYTGIYPKPPRQSSFSSPLRNLASNYTSVEKELSANTARRSSLPQVDHSNQKRITPGLTCIEDAKRALEMLTNLCQESDWRWIDGLLLGGCLAYALEDFDKALDWYTKIVAIDSTYVH